MKLVLVVLSAFALSACAANHQLAMPDGGWHHMNPGKWTYQENALTNPPPGQMAVR
jgi:hypothetical protein